MSDRSARKTDRPEHAGHATQPGHTVLQPDGWPKPKGFANGIKARGEFVVLAGMVGWDQDGRFVDGLVGQTEQVLANIVAVLAAGGGRPEHIVRMTWYVRDVEAYRAVQRELGVAYRAVMGRHYPAMSVVEVSRLVEPAALVEIEATAVLP